MGRPSAGLALLLVAATVFAPAWGAVQRTPSLIRLTRDADLVVRVRIAIGSRMLRLENAPRVRPVVDAVVLETLHGPRLRRVTFAPHGRTPAEYRDGEEALVFLRRFEAVPELAATPFRGRVEWASVQEASDKILVDGRSRAAWIAAVRRYLVANAIPDPATRHAALGKVTIAHVESAEPRIGAAALGDLVADPALVGEADVPALDAVLEHVTVPIAIRARLLTELERRGLVEGPPRWARLVTSARGPNLLAAVRAAAEHESPEVTAALLRVVAGDDLDAAALAAAAVGAPETTMPSRRSCACSTPTTAAPGSARSAASDGSARRKPSPRSGGRRRRTPTRRRDGGRRPRWRRSKAGRTQWAAQPRSERSDRRS